MVKEVQFMYVEKKMDIQKKQLMLILEKLKAKRLTK